MRAPSPHGPRADIRRHRSLHVVRVTLTPGTPSTGSCNSVHRRERQMALSAWYGGDDANGAQPLPLSGRRAAPGAAGPADHHGGHCPATAASPADRLQRHRLAVHRSTPRSAAHATDQHERADHGDRAAERRGGGLHRRRAQRHRRNSPPSDLVTATPKGRHEHEHHLPRTPILAAVNTAYTVNVTVPGEKARQRWADRSRSRRRDIVRGDADARRASIGSCALVPWRRAAAAR